jgi:hypothetical protein
MTSTVIKHFCVAERPEAGPYTEIHGGNRPFKDGEVVTHDCIVVGGNPKPTLSWICITPPQSRNTKSDMVNRYDISVPQMTMYM